ncbi:MAG: DNA repair protein RecO [Bacteroidales bacterium]|nr:DNA repair protein RecO [Bacteroidales bacterium]
MIEKTKGIVLHQIKYSDSAIIAQLYTRKFGRLSFLVRGMRKKKSGRHNVFFQPLNVLDIVTYYKESGGMPSIKEFSVSYSPSGIYSDIKKSCVAIFIGEVLSSILKEESPNEQLFGFLENSIEYFDTNRENYANFHIAFLAGLSSYLGFEPARCTGKEYLFFDMLNGCFVMLPPLHGNYAGKEISKLLAEFFSSSYENSKNVILNGSLRNEILETLVRYYSIHLPGLKKIRSLEVLKEVFSIPAVPGS